MNLDEARAARREAQGDVPVVETHGLTFEMPAELPVEVALKLADLNEAQTSEDNVQAIKALMGVIEILFGDRYPEFLSTKPSIKDLEILLEGLVKEYGVETGESPASES